VPWVPDYYSKKKWFKHMPGPIRQLGVENLRVLCQAEQKASDLAILQEATIHESSHWETWDDVFTNIPHSNAKLLEMILPALAAIGADKFPERWQEPADLPIPVLEWLQGRSRFCFPIPLSGFGDIAEALMCVISEPCQPGPARLYQTFFEEF
jgi:hypothetical protein